MDRKPGDNSRQVEQIVMPSDGKSIANDWCVGREHPIYGEVSMMGTTGGEKYRWFTKGNIVSMIPLSFLDRQRLDNWHPDKEVYIICLG